MTFDLAACRLDKSTLETGTWCELRMLEDGRLSARPTTNLETMLPLIRVRAPGVAYSRALEALKREVPDLSLLTDEEDARILGTALVRGKVLVEWRNFVLDGSPIAWSEEKAISLISQRRWENLRGVISAVADNRKLLLEKQDAADKGNSSAGSSGQSNSPDPTGRS